MHVVGTREGFDRSLHLVHLVLGRMLPTTAQAGLELLLSKQVGFKLGTMPGPLSPFKGDRS